MILAAHAFGCAQATPNTEQPLVLESQKDKTSYSVGVGMGRHFKRQGVEVDANLLTRGFIDGLLDKKIPISEGDLEMAINSFQAEVRRQQVYSSRMAGVDNKKEGDEFQAANKLKEGVVTLPSGLQYKILKAGSGKIPTDSDTVECNYRGTLLDGTEFDNSYKREKPATFLVSVAILAWKEALKLMPVGSKWKIFMPPSLAYGPSGAGDKIGPNSTLIFEVELLSVN